MTEATARAHAATIPVEPRSLSTPAAGGRTYMLPLGFGTTLGMWGVGYLSRLSPGLVPSWITLILMLGCLFGGGLVAGRYTGRGWRAGLNTGVVAALLNMLILGSLVSGGSAAMIATSIAAWLGASLIVSALVAAAGGAVGARFPVVRDAGVNWTAAFAAVAATVAFSVLVVGGLVTGHEAGLAVVDWPNSFGHNMFLYPLSQMTGGIFYEHAHRLFGSFVGLTTLVLTIHLNMTDRRRWLRMLAVAALVGVISQGILGGLRVTGHFTTSQSPDVVSPSIVLAIVHAVFGQVVFGLLVSIAVFTSTGWRRRTAGLVRESARTDRLATSALVVALVGQLILGAVQRHTAGALVVHILMATVVTALAVFVGMRAWGMKRVPVLQRLGPKLLGLVSFQLMLGVGALAVTSMPGSEDGPWLGDVIVTTMHQATGAALLALTVMVVIWTHRLLAPPAREY